ncbi:MAG: DUF4340 domain-containing protein [Treponema sp.]|nr:DUF4340 domain-containing protein [Treponema sp.]
MNKRIRLAVFLIAGIVCMGLVLFFLTRDRQAQAGGQSISEKTAEPLEYIYNIGGADAIKSITVRNSYGEYTMTAGHSPSFAGYEDFPISDFYKLHFIDVASRLESAGFVTDEEENLSIFGLAPPAASLGIMTDNGQDFTLDIGYIAADNNMYVKRGGSAGVYLAYYFDVSVFLYSIYDLVDTGITPNAQKDKDDILIFDKIILGGSAREEIVIVKNDSYGHLMNLNLSPYRIIAPLNVSVSMEHEDVYESLFGMYAGRFTAKVSDNINTRLSELDSYGLLRPWSTLELIVGGISYRVLFSKPDANGLVYIYREGTPFVYESSASAFPWLEVTHFELMDKMVILPFIDSVSSVEIKNAGRTVTFSITGEQNRLAVKSGDTVIDTGNFRVFYQNLVTARYDEYNDVPVNTLTSPFLEIVYHYRDGTKAADTVSFYETAQRRVLTSLNKGRAHFTYSVYTDQLLSDLQRILSGERVRSFL